AEGVQAGQLPVRRRGGSALAGRRQGGAPAPEARDAGNLLRHQHPARRLTGGAGSPPLSPPGRAPGAAPIWYRVVLPMSSTVFDPACRACPRLARHLAAVRREHPDYYARPVPPFGDAHARLLIVGLAPGMHGANRTGRPFTGDYAGILLYRTLYRYGFANQPDGADPDD